MFILDPRKPGKFEYNLIINKKMYRFNEFKTT